MLIPILQPAKVAVKKRGFYLPHPLCPPLLQRRGGGILRRGAKPLLTPVINPLLSIDCGRLSSILYCPYEETGKHCWASVEHKRNSWHSGCCGGNNHLSVLYVDKASIRLLSLIVSRHSHCHCWTHRGIVPKTDD